MTTYKIVRMWSPSLDKPYKIIKRGLTLEEAQTHCRLESTHKRDIDGNIVWFDGYDEEDAK